MFLLNYLELLLMLLLFAVVFFVSSMQPMIMVTSMILVTLLYSYNIYSVMEGYWFSYALVMVMLSGVLVLFMYMVSLVPNEEFENYNLLLLLLVMFVAMGGYNILYNDEMYYLCLVLWESYVSMYNLFMVGFLFSIMLLVVWFSCMLEGAIRVVY